MSIPIPIFFPFRPKPSPPCHAPRTYAVDNLARKEDTSTHYTDGGARYGHHARDSDGGHHELDGRECPVCGDARLSPAVALLPDPVATYGLPLTPCRELLRAIIEDVLIVRRLRFSTREARKQVRRDVEWLYSESTEPFSFLWCYAQLELDPADVRDAYYGVYRYARQRRSPAYATSEG
jgi:hypothetical protein